MVVGMGYCPQNELIPFRCILVLVTDETTSWGGSGKSLFSLGTLEQVFLSFRAEPPPLTVTF